MRKGEEGARSPDLSSPDTQLLRGSTQSSRFFRAAAVLPSRPQLSSSLEPRAHRSLPPPRAVGPRESACLPQVCTASVPVTLPPVARHESPPTITRAEPSQVRNVP
ncbi:hypothetical protein AAFF_G00368600 [Aldrovandia affinis]|uniref:Uncharacterized protein n=1 Tax=Aldrovandia affinis TaxID=143900 RepID=A0AAD7WMC7_9TELE|nr:hypothetical protein AAFF_G00368600 [Aldrovandia affinis]